jgi:hypothetical protein
MREYRRRRREEMIGRFAGQLRRGRSWNNALVSAMVQRFGGVEGLARTWKQVFDEAAAAQPGSKFVFDTLFGLLRLIRASSR